MRQAALAGAGVWVAGEGRGDTSPRQAVGANDRINVAIRAGTRIAWDGEAGRVTNSDAAKRYLRREYRKGWTL